MTKKFIEGIQTIQQLKVLGSPQASIFSISSDTVNIYALADQLEQRGWHMDRQQLPTCLHFMISPIHEAVAEDFNRDLKDAVAYVIAHPEAANEGTAAMYGMVGHIEDKSQVHEFVLQTLDQTMRL